MKRLIKTIGIAILLVVATIIIEVPINYLFSISGTIGKIAIILALFGLLCLIIWRGIKSTEIEAVQYSETNENRKEEENK